MSVAYIGLGSNVGDRLGNIKKSIELLGSSPDVTVEKTASFYETKPVGYLNQPDFINTVVKITTKLTPHQLLKVTKSIEEALLRKRTVKWGPRVIDLDILIFDDIVMDEPHLRLPHPEIKNRAFVLVPLAEIAGSLKQTDGKTIAEILAKLSDKKGVKILKK